MVAAFSKALGQSFDPAFRGVFLRAFLITLGVFVLVSLATWLGLSVLSGWLKAWLAEADIWDWLHGTLVWLANAGVVASILVASFFLFPSIMLVAMSVFLEDIAQAVEARHYPGQPPARQQNWGEIIMSALGLLAATIVLNLVALPFYLLLLFAIPLNLILFYLLNGYLYGREYFEVVALRRLAPRDAKALRKRFGGRIILSGAVIAFLLTLPLVNLVTPILATAFLLHLFEDLRRRAGA